jgi:hypothetical protein
LDDGAGRAAKSRDDSGPELDEGAEKGEERPGPSDRISLGPGLFIRSLIRFHADLAYIHFRVRNGLAILSSVFTMKAAN